MEKKIIKLAKFTPYKRSSNGIVTIMLDYQPINSTMGWCLTHTFKNNESIEDIQQYYNKYINSLVSARILSGLTYNNKVVWLSSENQQNYKSAYDLAVKTEGSNLPYRVKIGDDLNHDYVELNTIDEITDFYKLVYNHIQKCINEGWDLKDDIDWTQFR